MGTWAAKLKCTIIFLNQLEMGLYHFSDGACKWPFLDCVDCEMRWFLACEVLDLSEMALFWSRKWVIFRLKLDSNCNFPALYSAVLRGFTLKFAWSKPHSALFPPSNQPSFAQNPTQNMQLSSSLRGYFTCFYAQVRLESRIRNLTWGKYGITWCVFEFEVIDYYWGS